MEREELDFISDEVVGLVKGTPCNYYGYVSVWRQAGKCWMGVENWDGTRGYEIGEPLYLAFIREFGNRETGR